MDSKFFIHKEFNSTGKIVDFYQVANQVIKLIGDNQFHFVDAGAGVGSVTQRIVTLCEKSNTSYQITMIEPLPENCVIIRQKFNSDNITLHQVAISDKKGEAHFVVPVRFEKQTKVWAKGTSANGFVSEKLSTNNESIIVDTIALKNLDMNPVSLLKLDLQGGELKALKGNVDNPNRPRVIYLEHIIKNDYKEASSYAFEEIWELLSANYQLFYDSFLVTMDTEGFDDLTQMTLGMKLHNVMENVWTKESNFVGSGYFLNAKWDISKAEVERQLVKEISEHGIISMQIDVFFVRKDLDNKKRLFDS